MGHGNEIGRIGRREAPVDPRGELPNSTPVENGGVVPPTKVGAPAEAPVGLPEMTDGYVPLPMADVAAPLHGEGAPVAKGVWDIVPDMAKMNELGLIPQRFAADLVLLRAQLSVPGIPLPEQADRLFQFYVAYAQRFVEMANAVEADAGAMNEGEPGAQDQGKAGSGQPGRKSGEVDLRPMAALWGENVSVEELVEPPPAPPRAYSPEEKATEVRRFTRALQDAGFSEFKDQATGKNGTKAAAELLLAKTPAEVRARAQQIQLRPAQPQQAQQQSAQQQAQLPVHARATVELPAQRVPADAARLVDPARVAAEGRPELRVVDGGALRVQPLVVPGSQALSPKELKTDPSGEPFVDRLATTSKRLGPRMFWNVLHTFRGHGEDAAVFQDKWDKLTFGAILLLVGLALAVIVLVSL
jgi:hypothetical protein